MHKLNLFNLFITLILIKEMIAKAKYENKLHSLKN